MRYKKDADLRLAVGGSGMAIGCAVCIGDVVAVPSMRAGDDATRRRDPRARHGDLLQPCFRHARSLHAHQGKWTKSKIISIPPYALCADIQ